MKRTVTKTSKKRRRERPRVLALHAAGATTELWDDVAAAARGLDFLTPDLVTVAHAVGGRPAALARAIAGMVPTSPVVVAGCCVGANLALEVAALLGDRLRGALLLNPGPLEPTARFRESLRRFSRQVERPAGREEIRSWASFVLHRAGTRSARQRAERMLAATTGAPTASLVRLSAELPPSSRALAALGGPVEVLFGGENLNPFPQPRWFEAWRERLGPDRVQVLDGCRHWLPLEQPRPIAERLLAWAGAEAAETASVG